MKFYRELFRGTFNTRIEAKSTLVDVTIFDNYIVKATFSSCGKEYTMIMDKWKQGPFNKLVGLIFKKFGNETDKFGETTVEHRGTIFEGTIFSNITNYINILKYVCIDVFMCIEEIIMNHKNNTLAYCIHHCEIGLEDTYERYIHLVACIGLVGIKYKSNIQIPEIDFCCRIQEYDETKLDRIKEQNVTENEKNKAEIDVQK